MNGPHMAFFGRLTQDPELRYTANNGTPYLTMRIAVNTYRGEEQNQETIFINATLWRGQAENAATRCARGHLVYVSGRYSFREYDRGDSSPGYSHDVNVRDFRHFPPTGAPQQNRDAPHGMADGDDDYGENPEEDDLPL